MDRSGRQRGRGHRPQLDERNLRELYGFAQNQQDGSAQRRSRLHWPQGSDYADLLQFLKLAYPEMFRAGARQEKQTLSCQNSAAMAMRSTRRGKYAPIASAPAFRTRAGRRWLRRAWM